ncbi:MAG: oxygen-independent coproporphyrinogen III oxidase [Microscillaceae bacterium]
MRNLLQKYNVAGPRYTSYPTVPFWEESSFSEAAWKKALQHAFNQSNATQGISLYLHLPFCESLCTYCGCNTRITVNHKVERPYIEALWQEWDLYQSLFSSPPRLRELHFGGGTPTFFSPENLHLLLEGLFKNSQRAEYHEYSFEAHPHNTTKAHLEVLYAQGFRRLSLGIQDFDPGVQALINRHQTVAEVKRVTEEARKMGYQSLNFDLIYGLPGQTQASVRHTIAQVEKLQPDRIAFYSYAHVPWLKPAQRSLEPHLPQDLDKRALYELGKGLLEKAGYIEIGMDHFARPHDALAQAFAHQNLHRNFMGYTTTATQLLIGLGASSISDAWTAMAQNVKGVLEYQTRVNAGELPLAKGHLLSQEDLIHRQHILHLMCHFYTDWYHPAQQTEALDEAMAALDEMEKDGLVIREPFALQITPAGRPFVRNVAMAFDARLRRKQTKTVLFSQTV